MTASIYSISAKPIQGISSVHLGSTIGNSFQFNLNANNHLSRNVKKYEVFETTEDLLALSCAWFRIRNDRKGGSVLHLSISNMLSDELFNTIIDEDKIKANKIRDYYSKKIMILKLKDYKLTSFRNDLDEFIHGNPKKFAEKIIPLVYKLPEFYEFDTEFDTIKTNFVKEIPNFKLGSIKSNTIQLTPIQKIHKKNKRGNFYEYWLRDENDYAYRFNVQPSNKLIGLWDSLFSNNLININCHCHMKKIDDLEYIDISMIYQK